MTDAQYDVRLRAEADFQDARAKANKTEPRGKYYFLAARAFGRYRELLSNVSGKHCLVVGCAQGGGVKQLAKNGATVVGVDIASASIEYVNGSLERDGLDDCASAMVMNAEDLEFPSDSFDVIACAGVLHHLDVERACESWKRVLRQDGEIIMHEPMAWNPVLMLYRLLTPRSRTKDEHPLKPGDFEVLRKHFDVINTANYVLLSSLAAPLAWFPPLGFLRRFSLRVLVPVADFVLKVFPALRYLSWICVIQCKAPRKN